TKPFSANLNFPKVSDPSSLHISAVHPSIAARRMAQDATRHDVATRTASRQWGAAVDKDLRPILAIMPRNGHARYARR
ncbi:MAG: hypothetical protein KF735_24820, partial [Chelatococcus sp.]|uniref:hypothetical protein n=1 Tax=Chelatococcus sp. TaxID=1953771 RepID=UPI0025C0D3B9